RLLYSHPLSLHDALPILGLWFPPEAEHGVDARGRRQLELALNHPHEGLRFGGLEAAERLLAEYDVLGFAASGHPLSRTPGRHTRDRKSTRLDSSHVSISY